MAESDMRRKVVTALKELDAVSVENPAHPGTPDVNYVEGWIELKWVREWPKREETIVEVDHYTLQQRLWGKRRWRRHGNCWLLLQVRREWLLFDGATAAEIVGRGTRSQLIGAVLKRWEEGFDREGLIQFLREHN